MASRRHNRGYAVHDNIALRVRVDALDDDVQSIRSEMRDMRSGISSEISALSTKLDTRSSTNWQAWSVYLAAVVAIGTLAWWPIRESTQANAAALIDLRDKAVFVRRYEAEISQIRSGVERDRASQLRTDERSILNRGEISKLGEAVRNTDARLDAISRRLAEFIRDQSRK